MSAEREKRGVSFLIISLCFLVFKEIFIKSKSVKPDFFPLLLLWRWREG